MNTISKLALTLVLSIGVTAATFAADAPHAASASSSAQAAGDESSMTDGEVKKVDKSTGKITIKHGELKNLGMPAMTMVFQAKDKAMLKKVKTGDRISFIAEKIGGKITVTKIEPKK